MHHRQTLETERLVLSSMSAGALRAWLDGDAETLLDRTGARFPEPVRVPPLFDEDLPFFVERVEEAPADEGWWVWLARRREDDVPVGVCGLGGRPVQGDTMLGYSVYPEHEGRGYATEASRAVLGWAMSQPGVVKIVATVPVAHAASLRVAEKIGMVEVGRDHDDEVGDVAVYEAERGR